MTDNIQEKVYEKLWSLFKDGCPTIKNIVSIQARKDKNLIPYLFFKNHNWNNIWTIISKILPVEIYVTEKNNGHTAYHLWIRPNILGFGSQKSEINYFRWYDKAPLFKELSENYGSLWQALFSLLKEIELHTDKNKFEYRWGNEKSKYL